MGELVNLHDEGLELLPDRELMRRHRRRWRPRNVFNIYNYGLVVIFA